MQDTTRSVGSAHQEPHVFSFHRATHFRRLQLALSALPRTVIKHKTQAPEELILESLFVVFFSLITYLLEQEQKNIMAAIQC